MCLKRYVGDSVERMDWREEKTEGSKRSVIYKRPDSAEEIKTRKDI